MFSVVGPYDARNCLRSTERTVIATCFGDEVHSEEGYQGNVHENCVAFNAEEGMKYREETKSNGNDDDSDSNYEPANVIRRALTVIFSRVNIRNDQTSSAQDHQDLGKDGLTKMEGSETPEYSENGKDEKVSVTGDCLKDTRGDERNSTVVNASESKESVKDMKEVVRSMSAESCLVREEFIGNEGSVAQKIKAAASRSLNFQEDSMDKEFKEERFLYPSDVDEGSRKTIKAYYGMAGGFTTESSVSLTQGQEIEKDEYDISEEEWQTLDRICQGRRYVQKLPIPRCFLGRLPAETVPVYMDRKATPRLVLDYSKIAIGCGVAALTLFAVYKCFR